MPELKWARVTWDDGSERILSLGAEVSSTAKGITLAHHWNESSLEYEATYFVSWEQFISGHYLADGEAITKPA